MPLYARMSGDDTMHQPPKCTCVSCSDMPPCIDPLTTEPPSPTTMVPGYAHPPGRERGGLLLYSGLSGRLPLSAKPSVQTNSLVFAPCPKARRCCTQKQWSHTL